MSDCIEWELSRNSKGYGLIKLYHPRIRRISAHRRAWEIVNGPIPDGMQVLHRCDNPPCFNVEHLFLGTNDDNVRDKITKGRQATNELDANPNRILCAADVAEIRASILFGVRQRELAKLFGVKRSIISRIFIGKAWVSK